MTPARASLLLLTATVPLTVSACHTVRKPLRGFDEPPAGSIVLDADPGGTLMMWTMFDLPQMPQQVFRPRLNGQDVVFVKSAADRFTVRPVRLGQTSAGQAPVLEGLKPGEQVVIKGSFVLKSHLLRASIEGE